MADRPVDRTPGALTGPGATRPTLRDRLAEAITGEIQRRTVGTTGAMPHEIADAVLAVLADTGSPLTAPSAAEIEQRIAAATPGPWTVDTVGGLFVEAADGAVADLNWAAQDDDELAGMRADAEFIAAARTDLPELLAAYREVDAHRCVQADRIRHLEAELEERAAAVRGVAHDLDDELRDVLGWDWAHRVRDQILAAVDGTTGGEA